MHEMSIVEALLKTVCRELRAHPDARVRTLYVRIGRLRQVAPDMLQFCYQGAAQDTRLAGSRLEIEPVEARAQCDVCSLQFEVDEDWFECPRCHAARAQLLSGGELDLMSVELVEKACVR
jgi:hydrogenase nickel incorporation protein HypA/HybF